MHPLLKKILLALRYDASSFFTFLLELLVLYLSLHFAAMPYILAVPLAFLTTTLVHYAICHVWVFTKSCRSLPAEYTYFMGILLTGLLWTILLVAFFVQIFNMDVVVARIVAGIFTSMWNFYLNARFNFHIPLFFAKHKK